MNGSSRIVRAERTLPPSGAGREELRITLLKPYLLRLRDERGDSAVRALLATVGVPPTFIPHARQHLRPRGHNSAAGRQNIERAFALSTTTHVSPKTEAQPNTANASRRRRRLRS